MGKGPASPGGGGGGGGTVRKPAIFIPLYRYPAPGAWNVVAQAAMTFAGQVQIIAVVNASSGPGATTDPNYAAGIAQLVSAGVKVLYYVPTGYGPEGIPGIPGRPAADVEADMLKWTQLYTGGTGFFLDQVASSGAETYLSQVTVYAKTLPHIDFVSGNPGNPVPLSYNGIMDALNIYEGPQTSNIPAPVSAFPQQAFGYLIFAATSVYVLEGFSYVFSTPEPAATAYSVVTPYLFNLCSLIAAMP